MEEEKNNVENSAEPTGDQAADAQSSAVVPLQPDKPLSGKELRRQKKEAAAAQKAEAAAQKAREKAEAEAQKARQKEESLAAKLQRRQEKKEYRQGVRQERGQEIRLLWHIVEFIMLVTFIVLAIDQVGLYGFLFVWFFIALAAASIVLLLAGLIRAFRKKRAGIMILVSLIGIIGCIAWFIFLVSGILVALGHVYFPPEYFSTEQSLFPNWPIFDKMGTITLFLISMFMLIFPKFLGMIIYLKNNKFKNIGGFFGTIKSVLAEIVFSALIAPIMMIFQTKFVWEILTGQDVGWNTQSRNGYTTWKEAFQRHISHTILGVLTTYVVYDQLPALFYWMLPVTLGLMLSIPLSVLSSYEGLGRFAFKHNWFVIPEEKHIPEITATVQKEAPILMKQSKKRGVLDVIEDNYLLQIHTLMLEVNGPAPDFGKTVLDEAKIKLDNYLNYGKEPNFSREEEIALLYEPEVLEEASLELKLK